MKTSKATSKIIAILVSLLMIASITTISTPLTRATTVGKIGNTDPSTPGFPNLGTLPAGVTPQYTIETIAYLSFRPNPIGIGQSLLVNVWLSPGTYHAFPMTGLKVDIKKPDGTTMTVGPFNTYVGDSTAWFEMIPDQVGTWQFKFTFAGTYIPAGQYWDAPGSETGGFLASGKYYNLGASVYYTPSETEWQNLTVQENMVSSWPYRPMTTDYWTRPINPMWRDWGQSIGDYPFSTLYYYADGHILYPNNYRYTAYVTGPNSAHVLWKKLDPTLGPAGLIGGYTYDYSAVPSPSTPAIIYAGRCYQTCGKVYENGTTGTVLQCYDLRTGEIYWERPAPSTTTSMFGMTFTSTVAPQYIEYVAPGTTYTVGGGGATIARTTDADQGWTINLIAISGSYLLKYSPATGAITLNCSLSPLTSATYYMPGYALGVQTIYGPTITYRLINFTTFGSATTLAERIVSNISWTSSSLTGLMGGACDYEYGLAASVAWNTPPGPQWGVGTEIIVTDMRTGQQLWHYQTNDTTTYGIQSTSSPIWWHGKLAINAYGRHWVCFEGRTGKILWTSEQTEYPWGEWWPYSTAAYPYNSTCAAIITGTYEGVYAINFEDGKILWHYSTENIAVPFEGPYDAEPFFTAVTLADGKVYAYNGEHTTSLPIDRAWSTYCINATTGELIWKIHNPMAPGAVADGYLTASNSYDGYMYVFGKGPSSTTVAVSPQIVAQGSSIHIQGTVMDQSPAQPNTPCVSKDSMALQMEIIHMQMQQTGLWGNETLTGVPVVLTAISSDGTVIDIGTVTTNGYYGTFSTSWTPPKEGEYTIMASFAGDDSYGSSSAATTLSVGHAVASPTPPPASPAISVSDVANALAIYIVGAAIATIIAIVIVGAMLMKRR